LFKNRSERSLSAKPRRTTVD
jgi:hypothetical protein